MLSHAVSGGTGYSESQLNGLGFWRAPDEVGVLELIWIFAHFKVLSGGFQWRVGVVGFSLNEMFDGSMAMSFHSLKYPSHMMGNVHKHGILYRTMKNPILAVPPSSTLLQTDESGNLPESKNSSGSDAASTNSDSASLFINQATTVGIIGGVSVDSTLNFLKKLVQWSSKDGGDSLPFVLCSDPVLNKQLLSHERSHFPLLSTKRESSRMDHTPIVGNLQSKRAFLSVQEFNA
ncbi:hypothetical protein CK203_110514 [Vitis vinifera]|uniref:Uncharacterized protein n=1 Tax=Vitis vinifera TaxID=29760 RepID=A0A438D5U6_VITVI|nr:hypothetical protein CK203_110514 [Vitis vinifera]